MKNTNFIILITLLICSHLTSVAQQYSGPPDEIEKILKKSIEFSKAYLQKDFDAIADSYTIDAKILPPGTNIIEGRKAIKDRWVLPEKVQILHHKSTSLEIKIIEDYAYDMGYYEGRTLQGNGEEVSWAGKYIIVWKKVDGDWLMYLDIWNKVE